MTTTIVIKIFKYIYQGSSTFILQQLTVLKVSSIPRDAENLFFEYNPRFTFLGTFLLDEHHFAIRTNVGAKASKMCHSKILYNVYAGANSSRR